MRSPACGWVVLLALGGEALVPRCGVARMARRRVGGVALGKARPGEDAAQLERFFFDRVEVFVKSGVGGAGAMSSVGRRAEGSSSARGRPAGGDGGKGGRVVIECTADYNTLTHLSGRRFEAERGGDAVARRSGAGGADALVRVPPNVEVTDRASNASYGCLKTPGERLVLFEGGHGGLGNGNSGKQDRTAPAGGATKATLILSMTLLADVGLVGLPNAGKSTLLRAVSSARPKVADYPFTTLVPNLGVTEPKRFGLDDAESATWLDIPGLVAGAADGKGLGLAFLRHTERCRVLLHLVDGASDDVVRDVLGINAELRAYSAKLANTPQAVLVTKTDLTHVRDALQPKLDAIAEAVGHDRVLAVSSASGDNLKDLVIKSNRLLRGAARLRRTRAGAGATAVEPRGAPDAP